MQELLLTREQQKVLYRGAFTTKLAGAYLGIGRDKIESLIKQGEIGVVDLFGQQVIPKEELDKWLRKKTRYFKQGT